MILLREVFTKGTAIEARNVPQDAAAASCGRWRDHARNQSLREQGQEGIAKAADLPPPAHPLTEA